MQAKIAELEAQLSMALVQDVKGQMQQSQSTVQREDVKPQIDVHQSFNLPQRSPK